MGTMMTSGATPARIHHYEGVFDAMLADARNALLVERPPAGHGTLP